MGCTQSKKIENEESVKRCKERKQFMTAAVSARNAFAAAHSAYAMALKNTGAALSDYGQDETPATAVQASSSSSSAVSASGGSAAAPMHPPVDKLPPPPPPLPPDLSPVTPLQRSASMPGLPVSKVRREKSSHDPAIIEEDEPEATTDDADSLPPLQKPVRKTRQSGGSSHHRSGSSGGGSESKRGKMVAAVTQSVSFLQILNELDDHFLKASESAHEVSKMLEATRLHYHSNFADNRGHIDHSEKVMKVITWNKSIKGICCEDDTLDVLDDERWETHATILDKMLAWEKKLYDEVKAGEFLKIDYHKKVILLNKQRKHGTSPETLEKSAAAVSHLHTRYMVDMLSMDSTILEINNLRDHKLYPKLVELVHGMATMWEAMHLHHSNQHKVVAALRACDVSITSRETSEQHHDTTIQLWQVVREWHSQFQNLVTHQKEYIQALNSWLRLNLIPIESSLKERVSSPPRTVEPPILDLLHAWHDKLEKLPDVPPRTAIYSFSEVINTIVVLQEDELKLKEKCEETRKEFVRKKRAFEDWHPQENDQDDIEATNHMDLVEKRKFVVETVEIRLKSEEETYQKTCRHVREKSVVSLRTHLPELFRAMSDFSLACSEIYKQLRHNIQLEKNLNA
ncbi:hypothetical protein AXF42_Ash004793 [Apostasia shenzhenica]|uniref:DUF632 domain-containing protein n=1 Tax=Apostasia shenzhenica TaxID=1088818 RepID=A0A2I0BHP3_9ASPA|nr:hypothetical protein AXF42_Ash004793 [Apostasia shenzhenica]